MPPVRFGEAPPQGQPPAPVVNAVRLMFVNAALSLIGLITLLATRDSLRTAVAKQNPDYDADKLNSAVNAIMGVGAVLGAVFIVLYILLALRVRKGRNWARVVTWVLAGLGVLSALGSLGQTEVSGSRVLSLVAGAIDVAIIVLLAQKPSQAYFRRRV
jgi:hypothetical protein